MSDWDNLNINIGYARMFEEPQTTSDSSSESETTQTPSTSYATIYVPTASTTSIPNTEKKKTPSWNHVQNFFGYLFLFCAVIAVVFLVSGAIASMLEARNIQINCILGFIASPIICVISAAIAFH